MEQEVIDEVINEFFKGKSSFERQGAFIWVVKHKDFDTLTIEPNEGGQYEVAVRIWSEGEWMGYRINHEGNIHCNFLIGINTRGH